MRKRGVGLNTGRGGSMDRSHMLKDLEANLRDMPFPMKLEDLQAWGRDIPGFKSSEGTHWTLADLLVDVPVAEFSSPAHVAEVVRLRWEDMADLFRPGGHGPHGPWGPTEEHAQAPDETTPHVRAHGEAVGKARDRKSGP